MSKRFVIEGEWTGYCSSQRHVVHRTVHSGAMKKLRVWAEKTYGIRYTDGTTLLLRVRDCEPRERVKQICGYLELISDCAFYDATSVEELESKRKQFREQLHGANA